MQLKRMGVYLRPTQHLSTLIKTIQNAYMKMKLLHPAAKHIVCIFRIPGNRAYECEDFCDDKEHSCGKSVLSWMKKYKIGCRMFFIIRQYGGTKLGPSRHQCYITAAQKALENNPINTINGENQLPVFEPNENRGPKNKPPGQPQHTPSYKDSLSHQRGRRHMRGISVRGNRGGNLIRGGSRQARRSRQDAQNNFNFEEPTNVLSPNKWPSLGQAHSINSIKLTFQPHSNYYVTKQIDKK